MLKQTIAIVHLRHESTCTSHRSMFLHHSKYHWFTTNEWVSIPPHTGRHTQQTKSFTNCSFPP